MSLAGTASGRLFSTWCADEAATLGEPLPDPVVTATVREQGLATSRDGVVPGVSAAAAPIFDASGRLVLALTAIGPSPNFDTTLNGALSVSLREAASLLSRRLGH